FNAQRPHASVVEVSESRYASGGLRRPPVEELEVSGDVATDHGSVLKDIVVQSVKASSQLGDEVNVLARRFVAGCDDAMPLVLEQLGVRQP
ncbi:hypothetical protein B4Q13_14930, partial [Lacticaseibacillus rhamnosus]